MVNFTKISVCFVLCIGAFSLKAQFNNVGEIVSYKKTASGIIGKTTKSTFKVTAVNANSIRVQVANGTESRLDDFSYALKPDYRENFSKIKIQETKNIIQILTDSLVVEIEKLPAFRIIFKNKSGKIINEDVAGQGFGTTFFGEKVTVYKKLFPDEKFVGLGEALGNLNRRGTGVALNNTDTYKYGDPRLSMYSSIPFFIGIHSNEVYGLFFNNTHPSFFNFGLSTPFTSISASGGDADYFFFYDRSVAKIIEHYTSVTGTMPMPPAWALGYHQSRCSYYPQSRVLNIAQTFKSKNIPIDCIVLDADYLQDYEPFRINKDRFPDLPLLSKQLAEMNIEITASVNPGIKIDSSYEAHLDGVKKDVFLKYADGNIFISDIAPSTNNFPDFTKPATRKWWVDKMKFLPENGIHGYWNDMNEPAVGGSYLPDNLVFDFDGRKANSNKAKNVYGMQMARSSFESAQKYSSNLRPFILTRSGFAGVQRYSAMWSGDNTASDEGLLSGVLLNNQLGLSGIAFAGPDVGGYIGDGTKDLFKRWMQIGTFSPYFRNHKEFFATANEPWNYGEEAEAISKTYIGFRYKLLPYIYGAFYEATQTGLPVSRSLSISHPFDANVYDNLYQYESLFGDALLVIPVTTAEKAKKIYLPEGEWYDLYSDELFAGNQHLSRAVPIYQLPIFVKGSSIIPMQSLVQSTKDKHDDTLTLHVYNGTKANSYLYYEDAGNGLEYQNGSFCKKTIAFDPQKKLISISAKEGNINSSFQKIKIILHGFDKNISSFMVNGGVISPLQSCSAKLLDGLEYLGDIYDKSFYRSLRNAEPVPQQQMLFIENTNSKIEIHLQ